MRAVEILELREQIAILKGNIESAENYIKYLDERYVNPIVTKGKYREKIQKWKKEKYNLEKELLVLENEPCNK